jgi:hypothetical protein
MKKHVNSSINSSKNKKNFQPSKQGISRGLTKAVSVKPTKVTTEEATQTSDQVVTMETSKEITSAVANTSAADNATKANHARSLTLVVGPVYSTQNDESISEAKIGRPTPFFKAIAVVDGEFKTLCFDDFKGKYLVIFFFMADL